MLRERCSLCGQMVQVDKFLLGSLHVCVTEEEEADIRRGWQQAREQRRAQERVVQTIAKP